MLGATVPKSQDRLKLLLPDGSTGSLVVSKAVSLNLNFSFPNRISLLLISRGWVDPFQTLYFQNKIIYLNKIKI